MLCRCDCGNHTNGNSVFLPGHDQKAVARVIKEKYGTVEAFLKSRSGGGLMAPFNPGEDQSKLMDVIRKEYGSIEAFLDAEGY